MKKEFGVLCTIDEISSGDTMLSFVSHLKKYDMKRLNVNEDIEMYNRVYADSPNRSLSELDCLRELKENIVRRKKSLSEYKELLDNLKVIVCN